MAERGDPEVLRFIVIFLRSRARMTQEEFGREVRVGQAEISKYELGKIAPPEEVLRRMARVADVPWPVVMHLIRFTSAALAAAAVNAEVTAPLDRTVLDSAVLAVLPYLVEEAAVEEREAIEELLHEAGEIWAALEPLPAEERRQRIEAAPPEACRSWAALTRIVCEASVRSAADSPEETLQVAQLALLIAGHVTGGDGAMAKAHGWGYVANARRVGNDFDGADEAFTRAWELWPAGADSWLFPEWRLLSLEASLRRAQQRWPEALERLDRARARSGGDRLAAAQILLQKEHVLQQMGDSEGALAVLEEATPLVETLGDPHLLFALRFNTADNLTRLERCEEAAPVLPEVQSLAGDNSLDQTRVLWLGAKVKAGTGQKEEAMADLEKVLDFFSAEELPYDAALAGLDLSVLWLEAGRTAEVRELADAMTWIFVSKKIGREALAALTLFCDAARQEAATVALARTVIAEVEKARRSRPLPAE